MSNDQSPPVRKVVPYKKGGRRKSPFADLALQFSGTALDVAIQQRQEEAVAPPQTSEEAATPERTEVEPAQSLPASPVNIKEAVYPLKSGAKAGAKTEPEETDAAALVDGADLKEAQNSDVAEKPVSRSPEGGTAGIGRISEPVRGPARSNKLLSISELPSPVFSFDDFIRRWAPVLKSGERTGKLQICQVIYDNTHAVGKDTYFTSYKELARLCNCSKKQAARNIRQLENMGFVERTDIFNTKSKQGTNLRLHITPLMPGSTIKPRHHLYEEDEP